METHTNKQSGIGELGNNEQPLSMGLALGNVIAVDTETSGLLPWRHGVLSIGAVKVATGEEFYAEARLDAFREWTQGALNVNGFAVETLYDHPERKEALEVWKEYMRWIGPGYWMLAGQNVGKHDLWFLEDMPQESVSEQGMGRVMHRSLDLHSMYFGAAAAGIIPMPERGMNSEGVWSSCGLGPEPMPHHGMEGARRTAHALRWILEKMAGSGVQAKPPLSLEPPALPPEVTQKTMQTRKTPTPMTVGSSALFSPLRLVVSAEVRYWEDAEINGRSDTEEGTLIPLKVGNLWKPSIELETGRVLEWPQYTTADIHYKVCDQGEYWLEDAEGKRLKWRGDYVPNDLLAIGDNGYGDCIILKISAEGIIEGWNVPTLNAADWENPSVNQ